MTTKGETRMASKLPQGGMQPRLVYDWNTSFFRDDGEYLSVCGTSVSEQTAFMHVERALENIPSTLPARAVVTMFELTDLGTREMRGVIAEAERVPNSDIVWSDVTELRKEFSGWLIGREKSGRWNARWRDCGVVYAETARELREKILAFKQQPSRVIDQDIRA